jgi:Cu/Ag efflux protein CusF
MNALRWLGLLLLAVSLTGCQSGESKRTTPKEYPIKGTVTAVNPDKPSVKLDHEDIPGLMRGMEMEFKVADKGLLEGIKVGDQVEGHLKKDESGYLITRLEKR